MHGGHYDEIDKQLRKYLSGGDVSAATSARFKVFEAECATADPDGKWAALRFYGNEKGSDELSLPVDVCCACMRGRELHTENSLTVSTDDPWYLKFEVEIAVVCALFVVYVCLLSLEGIVLSVFAFSQ